MSVNPQLGDSDGEKCDPLKVREALTELLREGIDASITCEDADVERGILVFRAADLVDEKAEKVMWTAIDRICRSEQAQKLGVLKAFRLVALLREPG